MGGAGGTSASGGGRALPRVPWVESQGLHQLLQLTDLGTEGVNLSRSRGRMNCGHGRCGHVHDPVRHVGQAVEADASA